MPDGVQSRCVTLRCVSQAQDCSADERIRICTQVTSVSFLVCYDTCQIAKRFSVFILDQFTSPDLIFIMAMQDVINKMKGTALGVAEYLTPVLKVRSCHSLGFRFMCRKLSVREWICYSPALIGIKVSRNWSYYTRGSKCTFISSQCIIFMKFGNRFEKITSVK